MSPNTHLGAVPRLSEAVEDLSNEIFEDNIVSNMIYYTQRRDRLLRVSFGFCSGALHTDGSYRY